MKTIILLIAILAFTSARFNSQAFYQGFTKQLNFSPQQHAEVQACGQELSQTVRQINSQSKSAIQAKVLGFLFASDAKHREVIISLEHYLQNALPACKQLVYSVGSIFASGTRSPDEQYVSSKHLLKHRFAMHASVIVSSLVRLHDELKHGKEEKAGESLAFVLQVFSGVKHPATMQDYARNLTSVVEVSVMEQDKFAQESINNALKELGCKGSVTEGEVKQLRESIQNLVFSHLQIQNQLRHAQSVVEREVILLGAVRDLVKVGAVVQEQFKNLLAPHYHDLHLKRGEGKKLLKKGLHNYYLHLPQIEHRVVDLAFGIQHRHPVQTGHAIAGIVKIVADSY